MRYLLVLWDVDFTLLNAGGVGTRLYRQVFRDMFGTELPGTADMAGRTDRAIVLETLGRAGIPEPRRHLDQFLARMAALAPAARELAAERCQALPGAVAAVGALAGFAPAPPSDPPGATLPPGAHGPAPPGMPGRAGNGAVRVVQSLLTGNVRPMAEIKVGAIGLGGLLDFDAGAYGDAHEIRSDLVSVARRNAARRYGTDFAGQATVLVGDTPLDVAAALETGARAVAVATGGTGIGALAEAGAHAVLPDLTDTPAVLAAILGSAPQGDDDRL